MDGRKVLLAGLLLLGTADLVVLDLVAAPAWIGSAVPSASVRHAPGPGPLTPASQQSTPPVAGSLSVGLSPSPAASASVVASASPPPDPSARPAASEPAAGEPAQEPATFPGAPTLPRLLFEKGSARLTPEAVDTLMKASRFLKSVPDSAVAIHAHGWDGDDPAENRALSDKRASKTADFLAAVGVDRARLRVVAHGADQPLERDGGADAAARNRRVELVFEARASTR